MKMRPEIELLAIGFTGKKWDVATQSNFMSALINDPNFEGTGKYADLAFGARDRINRGPKALGLVDISPTIKLTDAGKVFLDDELSEEALLRQLLKFQLPSPFHKEPDSLKGVFFVKPYLEMFRFIRTLENVSFDELMLFGMQLTHFDKFNDVVNKVKTFRAEKLNAKGRYKEFIGKYKEAVVKEIYADEILSGSIKTRESKDESVDKFIKTKISNLRDYTDACIRYLRATGLVSISQKGRTLSILPEKIDEVDFLLKTIKREPENIDDETAYKAILFNNALPILYTDNRANLERAVTAEGLLDDATAKTASMSELKKLVRNSIKKRKQAIIDNEVATLKSYEPYNDVMQVFDEIDNDGYYDVPLMLEWNTWRAMTMLDGGNIKANLKFDDSGQPMSTASGNTSDIVCDYGSFALSVEVTMQSGQRQYEMEGEPVSRHLAKLKKDENKTAYCFFIAPTINDSCIAHFYTLHLTNIAYYGGKSVIIPIELDVFKDMVKQSKEAGFVPTPEHVESLCRYSMEVAEKASDEKEWYLTMRERELNWVTTA